MHFLMRGGCFIVVASEMKQAVQNVEGDFLLSGVAVFESITGGCFSTNKDFAMLESEHIRRPLDAHEFHMEMRHRFVRNECDRNFVEPS